MGNIYQVHGLKDSVLLGCQFSSNWSKIKWKPSKTARGFFFCSDKNYKLILKSMLQGKGPKLTK